MDPSRINAEEYRQTIKELQDRVERATDQMHAVVTVILRHEQEQRTSESPSETVNRFLVEFHAGEQMVCYDALQQGGLVPRLQRARAVVQDALANPFAKQRLAEPAEESCTDWLRDLAVQVRELFARNKRLAQEHIGWEFLALLPNDHTDL